MIVVVKPRAEEVKIVELVSILEEKGFAVHRSDGVDYTILGLVGDTTSLNTSILEGNEIVKKIVRVQEPFKKANKLFHPNNSIIKVGDVEIGGKQLAIMAGPCSVESEEQIVFLAKDIKKAGAQFLRGGAYKPRSSPYSFQGLGKEALGYLKTARDETGLLIVSEVLSIDLIDQFLDTVDVLQVGARNMQNFRLLKELGKIDKPILLKRGMSATIEEWLMSAEYIMSEGNDKVILCERGIRTFENFTRNTLDISAIPAVKRLSHLPVIVDPSHASGLWWMVDPLAKASVAVGADGLMIEVHDNPKEALSDGSQSLKPKAFRKLMAELDVLAKTQGKKVLVDKEKDNE